MKDLLRLLGLFLLRNDLGSQDVLLLLQALALLIHRINQKVLLFLYLLQVSHAVLGCKGLLLCNCDIRFELNIVRLDLVVVLHQILELLLGLGNLIPEDAGFFLLGVVEFVDL